MDPDKLARRSSLALLLFLCAALLARAGAAQERGQPGRASPVRPPAAEPPAEALALEASAAEPAAGLLELRLAPGPRISGYAWDDAARVPWPSESPPAQLEFGELGRSELTGLYLTFNHGFAAEAALQPPGWGLTGARLVPGAGRFGGGMRLERDSVLTAELAPEARALRAWTLEFWLRPARLGPCEFVDLGGLLGARLDASGRLAVSLASASAGEGGSAPLGFVHPKPLLLERWNHVALVLDLVDMRTVRAVVNGEAQGMRVDPRVVRDAGAALVLGDVHGDGSGAEGELDELRFLARGASTAELAEHWRPERGPVERLRLFRDDGTPAGAVEELELWSEPLREARLDQREEWARGELVNAVATAEGLAWTSEHWSRIAGPERPAPRTTHPLVSLGGQRVLLFGGETRDTHLGPTANSDDTWILDGASGLWSRVATTLAPSPRCHLPVAYSPHHDLVLLVGGWWQGGWWSDAPPTTFGDTWVFHAGERRWEQRFPAGEVLPKLSDNGLVYLPSSRRFLMLGGNHAWTYDPEANRWEGGRRMRIEGENARPVNRRGSYTCALDPRSEQVLVFGGKAEDDPEGFVDQTGIYDPRTNTLTLLELPLQPAPRVRTALAWDPVRERFVLFGGVRDQRSQRFDDLWTFDPAARRWSEVARVAERPIARGGYFGLAYDEVADRFVLAAGRHAYDRWLDETWAFVLDERRAGQARYVFDRAAFPEARAWFAECDEEGGARVGFRFRSSEDGMRFGPWSAAVPDEGRYVEVELTLEPGPAGGPRVRAMGFRRES